VCSEHEGDKETEALKAIDTHVQEPQTYIDARTDIKRRIKRRRKKREPGR
jgi:hypothetical protein